LFILQGYPNNNDKYYSILQGESDVKSQSLEHATVHSPEMMKTFDSGSLVLIKGILLKESEK